MTIGIITLPLHTNYGGILQAYALQTILKRHGHKVILFERCGFRKINIWTWRYPLSVLKRILMKMMGKETMNPFYELQYNFIEFPKQKRKTLAPRIHTEKFIKHYLNRTFVPDYSSIRAYNLDAIIAGSDQVWRWRYRGCFGGTFNAFLGFSNDWGTKKIAYAASFGLDEWEYNEQDSTIAKELIKDFDAVSVREVSGIALCEKYLDYTKAVNVLDPTMLLDAADYMPFVTKDDSKQDTIFSYIIDITKDLEKLEQTISASMNLPLFHVMTPENTGEPRIVQPLENWLSAIYNSKMVVTDSFHGTVLSIIFNKPFWVMGNRDGGYARFQSLLECFGLGDRLVLEGDLDKDWQTPIDWEPVNDKRRSLKGSSLSFLMNNLSK